MPTINLSQQELNVLQGILKRAEGGSETPAVKSKKIKISAKDLLEKKYGK